MDFNYQQLRLRLAHLFVLVEQNSLLKSFLSELFSTLRIGIASGGLKVPCPPKFLEHIVMLCFERRFSKHNSVIRLKSYILPPKKFLGWLRH